MTGAELQAARKAADLTQADLAKRVGMSRDTVQYWEAKAQIGRWGAGRKMAEVLGRKMAEVLGLRIYRTINARAGGWGVSFSDVEQARLDAQIAVQLGRIKEREAQRLARRRVVCGARTRKGGKCRNKSEPGKCRCKFHGGKSTGAKTPEGLARIAAAQVRRWTAYRIPRESMCYQEPEPRSC